MAPRVVKKPAGHAVKKIAVLKKPVAAATVKATLSAALNEWGAPQVWEKHWSAKWGEWFWYHNGTGESVWLKPRDLSH